MSEVMAAIVGLVRQQSGMHLQGMEAQAERSVSWRMQHLGLMNMADYALRVQQDANELRALVELLVVPETWFFRYPESFDYLKRTVLQSHQKLHILSLPCSTGEEPYSIVMSLLMAGVAAHDISVDAGDISALAVQRAQAAAYGAHSFREQAVACRARFFDVCFDARVQQDYWVLRDEVRACVQFHVANIMQPCPSLKTQYDVIFCRNMLIYFDGEVKKQVLHHLRTMLKPKGLLFLGHGCSGYVDAVDGFEPVCHRGFVWRRHEHQIPTPPPKARATRSTKSKAKKTPTMPRQRVSHIAKPIKVSHEPTVLEHIEALANRGALSEAKALCQAYLQEHADEAQAWYFLGVLDAAEQQMDAACTALHKALYLEPNHHQSLIQLAGIMEHLGNAEQAHLLRQRAAACVAS